MTFRLISIFVLMLAAAESAPCRAQVPADGLPLPLLPLDDVPVNVPPAPTPYTARLVTTGEPLPEPMYLAPAAPAPVPASAPLVMTLPMLADQIIATNDAFLRQFGPNAKAVPEGKKMREDAEDLQKAALKFRQALRRNEPRKAEKEFREVEEEWRHLSARAEDIARRSGIRRSPTLDLIRGTGYVIQQIRRTINQPLIVR